MNAKHLCLLLLPFVVITTVRGQNGDDLSIPVENDNQYPPEQQPALGDGDLLEGSGNGAFQQLDESNEPTSTTTEQAPLEDVISPNNQIFDEADTLDSLNNENSDQLSCPTDCQCNIEGDDFVTNCAGLELTEMPSNIDVRTTKLKLQNNKLTEIPQELSVLTNLKELNASNNAIKELALSSISTLPQLVVLDLQNNKLREYPMELKNSFYLPNLKTIILGGNNIIELLEPAVLGKFSSLEKIVLPADSFNEEVEAGLCKELAGTLKIICIETCDKEISCPDSPEDTEDSVLPAVIPEIVPDDENENDPSLNQLEINKTDNEAPELLDNQTPLGNSTDNVATYSENNILEGVESGKELENVPSDITTETSASVMAKVEEASAISRFNTLVQTDESVDVTKLNIPAETTEIKDAGANTDANDTSNYKVGATTSDSKTGGVDKSVIGIIVAGMVVVVAGITIKKNWTSIKRKFSSNSRTPDRPAGNANGTAAPEEMPLQDKSPV